MVTSAWEQTQSEDRVSPARVANGDLDAEVLEMTWSNGQEIWMKD